MNKWKKKQPATIKPFKRPTLAGDGFGGRTGFFLSRAITNIRQNVFVNVVTIGTITLALLIVSLFLLIFVNLENATDSLSERVQVTVYFDNELSSQDQAMYREKIVALPGVSRVSYVTRDEALKRFKSRLRGQETLLEGVGAEILPTSFEIALKRSYRETASVENFVSALKRIPGITEVQYGEEWVRRFNSFLNLLRLLGALLGGFLIIAATFIVSNTIKLTIYSRRDELDIMSLVGATRFFIKAPFLLEGLIQGIVGSALAVVLLFGVYEGFLHNAGSFLTFNPATSGLSFLSLEYVAGLLLAGALLGFVGSLTSLKRFINV
ncbi:MAG: permease-like cell division protein FtsX [Desulfuromonadaceae bacterium]|nr:permease-like cell division protein FtsX [Desulfuromonadaceae bacterium]MDD2846957.1 permease-like cell division protein FtsX [Desulfuromonadaceae bacterium]MDD4129065.1 permease-like cell division protein FtsX [Desulfuromonadaceae bacterium]